jgi:riboflavin synthase
VQGHVDGRGEFISAVSCGGFWTVRIGYPADIGQYLVYKGSVSVEGISLTIASLTDTYFEIAIIPKTWELTNLSSLRPGDEVNLEADIIAKYVERIISYRKPENPVTMEMLKDAGFV